jgi:hypothetical protein
MPRRLARADYDTGDSVGWSPQGPRGEGLAHIPEKPGLDLIEAGYRFSEKDTRQRRNPERIPIPSERDAL